MPEPLAFEIAPFGPNVFFVGGELDMSTAPALEEAVRDSIRSGGPIVLDLSAVSFVDSMGIHAFVSIARQLGERGCLILHAPQENVRRVLEITRITDMAHIHVEPCPVVAIPQEFTEWTPPPDLAERFDTLRELIRGTPA
jgi:anti-sigma B factor antagonist